MGEVLDRPRCASRLPRPRISTSSSPRSNVRARRDLAGGVAQVPSGARHLRPAAGRCADAPGEDPAGVLTARQVESLADVAEQYARGFAHVTTRQNVQFHFLQLSDVETIMRRMADEGDHDARGVRQFGAQHHRVPIRRSLRRRSVRRHAVRRGADPLPAAPSARGGAAAQVQDRVRRLRRRSRVCVDQRSGLDRAYRGTRRHADPRLQADRRRRDVDSAGQRPRACSTFCRHATCSRRRGSHSPRLSPARRSRAPSAQSHEVPDQDAWVGSLARRSARRRSSRSGRKAAPALPFDPESPEVEGAPDWSRPSPPSAAAIRALIQADALQRAGHPSTQVSPWPTTRRRSRRGGRPTCGGSGRRVIAVALVRLPLGDITAGQLRALALLAEAFGDGTVRLTPDQNIFLRWVPESRDARSVRSTGRGRAREGRRQRRLLTSRAVRAPSRASSRSRSRADSAGSCPRRSRAPGPDRARVGRLDQNQRLPQRLRSASHRDAGVPGQRAQGRRPRRPAVLRDGRRQRDVERRQLRQDCREDPRSSSWHGSSSGSSSGIGESGRSARTPRAFFGRAKVADVKLAALGSRDVQRRRRDARRLHRPWRHARVRARSDGRGVCDVTSVSQPVVGDPEAPLQLELSIAHCHEPFQNPTSRHTSVAAALLSTSACVMRPLSTA